jgi:hypothetical protein
MANSIGGIGLGLLLLDLAARWFGREWAVGSPPSVVFALSICPVSLLTLIDIWKDEEPQWVRIVHLVCIAKVAAVWLVSVALALAWLA